MYRFFSQYVAGKFYVMLMGVGTGGAEGTAAPQLLARDSRP